MYLYNLRVPKNKTLQLSLEMSLWYKTCFLLHIFFNTKLLLTRSSVKMSPGVIIGVLIVHILRDKTLLYMFPQFPSDWISRSFIAQYEGYLCIRFCHWPNPAANVFTITLAEVTSECCTLCQLWTTQNLFPGPQTLNLELSSSLTDC